MNKYITKKLTVDAIRFNYVNETNNNLKEIQEFINCNKTENYKAELVKNTLGLIFIKIPLSKNDNEHLFNGSWLYREHADDLVTVCTNTDFEDTFDSEFDIIVSDELIESEFKTLMYDLGEINFDCIKSEFWDKWINKDVPFNDKQLETFRAFTKSLYTNILEQIK